MPAALPSPDLPRRADVVVVGAGPAGLACARRLHDLFVAGDHRDTSSIQGAPVSGRRAADAVLRRLGRSVPSHRAEAVRG